MTSRRLPGSPACSASRPFPGERPGEQAHSAAAALCRELRATGHPVYHPFLDRDQAAIDADPEMKQAVTREHFPEIDACDVLYALAPGGYVGASVVIEMAYAFARGKRVVTSEAVGEYAVRALVSAVAAPPDFLRALGGF